MSSAFRHCSALCLPFQPTPRKLTNPPSKPGLRLRRHPRRRFAPHSALAVEDHFGVWSRPRKAKAVFEFRFREEEGIGGRCKGNIDRGGYVAGSFEFRRFTDVDENAVRVWRGSV